MARGAGIGVFVFLWLSLVQAGEIKVTLVTPTGEPGVSGLTVRLLCGGQLKSEAVWKGQPLTFDTNACSEPVWEAGWEFHYYSQSSFVRETKILAGVDLWSEAVRLEVPVLTRVEILAEDVNGKPVGDGGLLFFPIISPEPDVDSRLRVADFEGRSTASLFLRPREYQVRVYFNSGVVRLEVDGQSVPLDFSSSEHRTQAEFRLTIPAQARPLQLRAVGGSATRVRGRVIDEQGNGVQGVAITWGGLPQTQADGGFSLVPHRWPVEMQFFDPRGRFRFDPAEVRLATEEEGKAPLEIRARPYDGPFLDLEIVDEQKNPVSGVEVTAETCLEGSAREILRFIGPSDAQGRVRIPCEPECPLGIKLYPGSNPFLSKDWTETPPACPGKQKVTLERAVILEGRVTDRKRQPVAGLELVTCGHPVETDKEGHFRWRIGKKPCPIALGWRPQPWLSPKAILVRRNPGKGEFSFPVVVEPPSGNALRPVELELTSGGAACVTIQDKDGGISPQVSLSLYSLKPGAKPLRRWAPDRSSDTARQCTELAPAGQYFLHGTGMIIPAWWPGVDEQDQAGYVEIKQGQVVELSPFTVERAYGVALNLPLESGLSPKDEEVLEQWIQAAPAKHGTDPARPPAPWQRRPTDGFGIEEPKPTDPEPRLTVHSSIPSGRWNIRLIWLGTDGRKVIWETAEPVERGPGGGGAVKTPLRKVEEP